MNNLKAKPLTDNGFKPIPVLVLTNFDISIALFERINKPSCAIIAVPDHLHYEVAKDCLDAGLHVLLVKPLTPTYEEGRKLVDLSDKYGLYGAVEFHKRWDRSNLILRDKIQSGELGKLLNCWIEYSQRKSIPTTMAPTPAT